MSAGEFSLGFILHRLKAKTGGRTHHQGEKFFALGSGTSGLGEHCVNPTVALRDE
jgi:hypothetical protein